MDKPDVFMPLYIGDYLAGTSRLTTELHGAYLLLIMDYWMNGPLPDDDDLLASITKMAPDAWSIARAKLEKYFSIADGFWRQKRVEEELAAATEKKRKSRERAKKAAAARWDNASGNATSKARAKHEECPSPSPSHSKNPPNPPKGDVVPYQEIVDLYHEHLPMLPKVVNISDKRKRAMRARWAETVNIPTSKGVITMKCNSLDFWGRYFKRAATQPFLTGDKADWHADFDFLLTKSKFIAVIEQKYLRD